jgi:hypothetical protein
MATHPQIEQLADLARNVLDDATAARLRAHSLRCASCRRTLDDFQAVAELGGREGAYAVPAATLAAAVGIAPRHGPKRASPSRHTQSAAPWSKLTALLVFDSWLVPQTVGVRSQGASERHLTFQSGEWNVDLRLERVSGATLAILGRVAVGKPRATRPRQRSFGEQRQSLSGVPVRLISGRRALASTSLNEFGEFQLECRKPSGPLRLDIPISAPRVRLDVTVDVGAAGRADVQQPSIRLGRASRSRAGTKPAQTTNRRRSGRPAKAREAPPQTGKRGRKAPSKA